MPLPRPRKLPPEKSSALLIRGWEAWPSRSIPVGSRSKLNDANVLAGCVTSNRPKDHRGGEQEAALVRPNQVPDQTTWEKSSGPRGCRVGLGHRTSLLYSRIGYLGETGSWACTCKAPPARCHHHQMSRSLQSLCNEATLPGCLPLGLLLLESFSVLMLRFTLSVPLKKGGDYQYPTLALTRASFQSKPGKAYSYLSHAITTDPSSSRLSPPHLRLAPCWSALGWQAALASRSSTYGEGKQSPGFKMCALPSPIPL